MKFTFICDWCHRKYTNLPKHKKLVFGKIVRFCSDHCWENFRACEFDRD